MRECEERFVASPKVSATGGLFGELVVALDHVVEVE
jgi:hypothetical protein